MTERIELCETCGENTPHGSGAASSPAQTGLVLVLASPLWLFLGWPLFVMILPTAMLGLCLGFLGRERFAQVDCQRCRHKLFLQDRDERRRRRIKLGPNTIIDPL